ncbi:MAG: hypothetical protein RLZZ292_322 [Bacteroidota bacterium]|jgi:molybdopterin molybdotransferase
MISVPDAEALILAQTRDYGIEIVPFQHALGRVLAENIVADRDLPPYHRVTMDGIAIDYQGFAQGIRSFRIQAIQGAGDAPKMIETWSNCIEIMTGAVLPLNADTIIRYEDLNIENGNATILIENIKQGQNIHYKGRDKQQGEIVVVANQLITPKVLQMTTSVGYVHLAVKRLPKVVVISSGDELVDVPITPTDYQIRHSNNYTIQATLQRYGVAANLVHIPDNESITKQTIEDCLKIYDVLLLSGGISMGKFDYIPTALEAAAVEKLFHKVKQKPGKPFWFGTHPNGALVFALPGNPVSTFMCLNRYVTLWLEKIVGIEVPKRVAQLTHSFSFPAPLHYFLQVSLHQNDEGTLLATPVEGNGSGDFSNLLATDAFLELPAEQNSFQQGNAYRVWGFE